MIPPARMKAGREHRVPLSRQALSIISRLHDFQGASDFVFPGQKPERDLSSSAMDMLLRRMDLGAYTVHGFRSAFRDWAGDETSFPREIAELALADRVGDATERAYRRADAIERRRMLTRPGRISAATLNSSLTDSLHWVDQAMDLDRVTDFFSNDYSPACERLAYLRTRSKSEALRFIAQMLGQCQASTAFVQMSADVIDLDTQRGRPKGSALAKDWHEIGTND